MIGSNIKIIKSEDGSHTLYNEELKETYHSTKGAVTESQHVFIRNGLNVVAPGKESVKVLEIGFGTGLNALLTLKESRLLKKKVAFHTLEPFPLPREIYTALNYPAFVEGVAREDLNALHEAEWNAPGYSEKFFELYRYKVRLEDFVTSQLFDLVFYDAFAPSKQQDIWELSNLEKVYRMLAPGGVLVTYCASGQFKRNLKAAGFKVETLPGPPGKKEMTRGIIKKD